MSVWEVRGRLVHADPQEAPLHHVNVELWDKDLLWNDKLGETLTDADGRFVIQFDPGSATHTFLLDRPDLVLVIVELARSRGESGEIVETRIERARIVGPKDASEDKAGPHPEVSWFYNFGNLRVEWWEYRDDSVLPRLKNRTTDNKPAQEYAHGYWPELVATAGAFRVVHEAHRLATNGGDALTLEQVQRDFDIVREAPTRAAERHNPGSTRTPDWFGMRVLNGFNPAIPELAGEEYVVRFSWDEDETDGVHDAADVEARFVVKDGRFVPLHVQVELREPGQTAPGSPKQPAERFEPDHPRFAEAMRVFRATWNTAGECDAHLAACHLNCEQYAIAAWRNLRRNPIRDLLFPHLREVVLINQIGDDAIFGTTGILASNTPLTVDAARRRLVVGLGKQDWRGWRPRKPICESHQYAKVANLYWELLEQHVRAFVNDHRAAIEADWFELHRFSNDLVDHAVTRVDPDGRPLYDDGELPTQRLPSGPDGKRAVSPLTQTDEPASGEIEGLIQLCQYVIFHATLGHTWSNDKQVEDGGEIEYGPLALRNGALPSDWIGDHDVLPNPIEASAQLYFANSLNAQTRGLLTQDEDRDIHPRLRALLLGKAPEFEALGFHVGRIRSRINI